MKQKYIDINIKYKLSLHDAFLPICREKSFDFHLCRECNQKVRLQLKCLIHERAYLQKHACIIYAMYCNISYIMLIYKSKALHVNCRTFRTLDFHNFCFICFTFMNCVAHDIVFSS